MPDFVPLIRARRPFVVPGEDAARVAGLGEFRVEVGQVLDWDDPAVQRLLIANLNWDAFETSFVTSADFDKATETNDQIRKALIKARADAAKAQAKADADDYAEATRIAKAQAKADAEAQAMAKAAADAEAAQNAKVYGPGAGQPQQSQG